MTKREVLESLVKEGLAEDTKEAEAILADMGMTWKDIRDGKWY